MSEPQIEEFEKLPRNGMRVMAFRKYEQYIARACVRSYVLKPGEFPGKASSFMVGFNEARRGFEKFGYKSEMIPLAYDLRRIKLHEGKDGSVLVQNEYEDRHGVHKMEQALVEKTVIMHHGKVASVRMKQKPNNVIAVDVMDVERFEELMCNIRDNKVDTFADLFLVKVYDGVVDQERIKEAIAKWHPPVIFEELNEGFWRVN